MTNSALPGQAALYTLQAEEATLGSMLINPECIADAKARIKGASDFYLHKHQWIWTAVVELDRLGSAVDFITVSNYLEEKKQLGEVGGVSYLTQLINSIPTSLHVEAYASIVAGDAVRRKLIEAATAIAKLAY